MRGVGSATYYTRSKRFRTPILFCRFCDIYGRITSDSDLEDHYYAASYVRPENEARFRQQRAGFFSFLLTLVDPPPGRLADFGSSYGHLLEQAKLAGFEVCGIELNSDLVAECNNRGLLTVSDLQETDGLFNAICFIDSFYCLPDPGETLEGCRNKLAEKGKLLIRITNRNSFARSKNRLKRQADFSLLGDATFSYSQRGLGRVLSRSGFRIVKVLPDYGTGKAGLGAKTSTYYRACRVLGRITFGKLNLAPGLIIVAERSERAAS
jgi:SAM-dependent methyltransferase